MLKRGIWSKFKLNIFENKNIFIIIILLIVFSAYLRFKKLTYQSLWLDELYSINLTTRSSILKIINYCMARDVHPPFYYLSLKIWENIFGVNEYSVRFLSAVFGVLGVFSIYFLGKELFSKRVGLFSAAILSSNYFHLYYSQEVRMYSLLFLLSTLSFLFLIKLIKAPSKINAFLYITFTLSLIYTHYFGFFSFVSQIIFLVFFILTGSRHKDKIFLKHILFSVSTISILYFPWIFSIFRLIKLKSFWIPKPPLDFYVDYFKAFFGYEPFLVTLFSVLFLIYLLDKTEETFKQHKFLLLCWIIITLFIPYLRSLNHPSLLQAKYAIAILPALIIIVSKGIDSFSEMTTQYLLIMLIIIMSLINIFYTQNYYGKITKQQWREAASLVLELDRKQIYPIYGHEFFNVYYKLFHKDIKVNLPLKSIDDAKRVLSDIQNDKVPGIWILEAHSFLDENIHSFLNKELIKQIEKSYYYSRVTLYTKKLDLNNVAYFTIPFDKLFIFGQAEIKKDEGIVMPWNVKLQTSEISFEKGLYEIIIEAKGSEVDGVYSRIKVYSEGIFEEKIFYLTDEYKKYKIRFKLRKDIKGSVLVEFDNDAYRPEFSKDRNVWVKSIEFKKIN